MSTRPPTLASRLGLWLAVAVGLSLASTAVRTEVHVVRPEIMGCEAGCNVAAVGWPTAYVVDGVTSPVGSADLVGALLDMDEVDAGALARTFAFWTVVAAALAGGIAAVRRRGATPPADAA